MYKRQRNNLSGGALWEGRLVVNTTTNRINRYSVSGGWSVIAEIADLSPNTDMSPIGAIIAYASNVAPPGWHLCDGTTHGSSALNALLTAGGHPNPHLTPNLKDKFILGDGGTLPNSGGAATVTLTAAQSGLPGHAHTAISGPDNVNHYHLVNPPSASTNTDSHTHTVLLNDGSGESEDGNYVDSNPTNGSRQYSAGVTSADAHYHTVDIPQFNSDVQNTKHNHPITVNAVSSAPASASHENLPPYYALTYIIKKS